MRSRRSSFSSNPLFNLRQLFARGWRRRVLCLVLIFGLLIIPDAGYAVRAATGVAVKAVKNSVEPIPVAVHYFKRLFRRAARPRPQETTVDRSARVASIQITPAKIVGYQNQQLPFTAIGRDANGDIAQGARFAWSSSDTDKLQIDNAGMATLLNPGLVWVTAATANASARVPVLIRAGNRPQQSDSEFQNDQDQLHPDGTTATSGVGRLLDSLSESLLPTAHAQTNGGDSGDFGYDELWNDPRNLAGMPRNRVMSSTAIGAVLPEGSDFEFSVPIWGLPGRGLPLGVAMNYNSRIWSRHGSAVTFNAINSWPFLGFTLGFGRIVTYASGSNTKFVLIDSDGTRHYLGSGPAGTTQTYQTNDGSHITYVGNATTGGTLYYNSGLQKTVALGNNRLLVTGIADTNGNYLSIAYAWQSAPCQDNSGKVGYVWTQALSSMTDTLGRVISFNYDCFNYLTSITAPGQNGSSTTIAQFDYALTYPSTSFSGLTVENVPSGKPVPTLSHVYNPTTQTGYKLTYSAYGMISKVSLRKQMSYDSNTGVISDGTEKAYVSFNYPASASSLTDAPSFSQWTQSPAATTGGTATWSFTSSSGSGTKAFTLTNPDSSTLTLTRSDNTSAADYGLLTQSEVKTSGGTSMAKAVISYANDSGGQPQVANVVSYDELSQPTNETKVDFDYDSYGNVTNLRDYGHQQSGSWVVRRRTHNVYKTDTSYVNAYLRSLVIESDTYDAQLDTNDANDVLVAKSTFTFDDYSALGGMENYGGNYSGGSAPPGYNTAYNDTTKTVRGNLTGRTAYYDITGNLSYTWLRKVDIFGNVTKEELSCCNIQTITYSGGNDFALAEQVTKGPSGGPQVTMSTSYTFNTSATSTTTDPNSQTTTVTSRDDLLRPTLVTYPTSATMSKSYNDNTPSVTQTVSYSEGQTQQSLSATTTYDDWGRVIQQTNGQGGQVNTEYDQMGRVARVSNPFSVGGSPSYWTSYSYDALGRTTTVTLPDNQTVVSSYSGDTVTVTDQVGRQMQRVSDGLGRLVTVNEQDSSGNLSQATNYTYDVLNNLTQVNQGGQLRSYKYDALSRLLYENIPEQSATINDGSGTYWTSKYTYTSFNAVATKQDARGVVTSYSYDSLNRVSQVSYNTVSGVTSAPTVSYTYDSDSTYNTTASGKLLRVNVGSDYQERYTFDSAYRIASMIRTIGSRSYTSSYGYNQASQLTQLTYPSSRAINVTHDSSGRLSGLNEGGNGPTWLSSVSYDIAGQVTGDTLGNGITEQFGYDAARMQMTSQKAGTASPYTNRMDLTYSYNATSSGQFGAGTTSGNPGQLLSLSGALNQTTESASYTYDNVGRLVTSSQTSNSTSAQRRFDYDRFGNRTNVWDA
ncbi:MAG TPA: hypothetical protein VKA60_22605, partial [Blastocatellia bacterium]|nr:hypothetical protein [Blastocatellia bacterium]